MKIAMVFPGYSSQFVGMGKELYDEHRIIQEYFEEASNCLDMNFVKLCFASSDVELAQIGHAYPALFLVGCSIFALLKEQGIKADVLAGYDQGEYTALFAAGSISFPDGLYLLSKYSAFYQDALTQMDVAAIRISGVQTQKLEEICLEASAFTPSTFVSIYNSPTDHVVSGSIDAVEQVRELIGAPMNVTIDPVNVEGGLHSPFMDGVVDQFKIYLEKVDFKDVSIPVISSGNGEFIYQGQEVKNRVIELINKPIVWSRVMHKLADYDLIIEIGPGNMLTKMMHATYPDKLCVAINKQVDIDELHARIKSNK